MPDLRPPDRRLLALSVAFWIAGIVATFWGADTLTTREPVNYLTSLTGRVAFFAWLPLLLAGWVTWRLGRGRPVRLWRWALLGLAAAWALAGILFA